jgi:type II secretory pathway component GspD/PulD (secretin)
MLRAVLLAVALVIPGSLCVGETPPQAVTPAPAMLQPCSDFEKSFPPCGIPKADQKKSRALYQEARKLVRKKQLDAALEKLQEARAISPLDTVYMTTAQAVAVKVAADELRKGNLAMQKGDAVSALTAFRRAAEVEPTNEYAQQRLRDALPPADEPGNFKMSPDLGTLRLRPSPGLHSFEFRGNSAEALVRFGNLFGITAVQDQGLIQRRVRINLDNVSWETGSEILQQMCKVLLIPLSEKQVMLVNDTEQNRREMTQMSLRTFYAVGGSTPEELTNLSTALRILFDLRFITPNVASGTITVRAPQPIMDAITEFLDDLQDDRPVVMLDVKIFEVSTNLTKDLGTSVPNDLSVFNITSEINSLLNSSSYQQIVAALQASGQPVNFTTILAALLASSSSTSPLLSQPFLTFGGGQTLSAVTLPATSVHFSGAQSVARTVDEMVLRAAHGKAATMKVGERYPIVSSQFAATSATSSLLATLGVSSTASAASIPSPQFSYEDLGLVMKVTPHVHGKLVSLDYELTVRALGATGSDGLPAITNREMKGVISTNDGESVVIAGLVTKSETSSINGIPLLSQVPVAGLAFSVTGKENISDDLLVVMTPHITMGGSHHGVNIPIPTNVPK